MRLLIISNMAHYLRRDQIVGWGPAVEEIDNLAKIFNSVVHIGCLHIGKVPSSSLPYMSKNIQFVPVRPAGGNTFLAKVGILVRIPGWIKVMLKELKDCDLVHLRCPANICLVALLLLIALKHPEKRWVKYSGSWNAKNTALSYLLQKWILHHNLHRGIVTINGKWVNQKKHEISFLNPSLSEKEVDDLEKFVEQKSLSHQLNIVFVGRLEDDKGTPQVIEAASILTKKGLDINLRFIGDCDPHYKKKLERMIACLDLEKITTFFGWLPLPHVKKHLMDAHFMVLPSVSEGWPKVLSEAFAHGVFCIASDVSSIPQIMIDGKFGRILYNNSAHEIAEIIEETMSDSESWKRTIIASYEKSKEFTYERYLKRVKESILSNKLNECVS